MRWLMFIVMVLVIALYDGGGVTRASDSRGTSGYDLSKLLLMDPVREREFGYKNGIIEFPAMAHFYTEDGQECLRYIGVHHSPGPAPSETEPGDPNFQVIQNAFQSYKPDFVIAEGFSNNPYSLECVVSDCDKKLGENLYAVWLAKTHHIPFVGGEPTDLALLEHLKKEGYTAEDMAAFYVTRQLPQLWRENNPILQTPNDLEKAVQHVIILHTSHFISTFSYADWEKWIFTHYNRLFSFQELTEQDYSVSRGNRTKLEKIADLINWRRDQEILTRILEAKDKGYKRLLVVYGGAHYYSQHKVLERYFGKPKYTPFEKS